MAEEKATPAVTKATPSPVTPKLDGIVADAVEAADKVGKECALEPKTHNGLIFTPPASQKISRVPETVTVQGFCPELNKTSQAAVQKIAAQLTSAAVSACQAPGHHYGEQQANGKLSVTVSCDKVRSR